MICRLWRGWTTPENAPACEDIVRRVIPEIEARGIPGFLSIDLSCGGLLAMVSSSRRSCWFEDLGAVKGFVGDDYEVAHVPERARTVLLR